MKNFVLITSILVFLAISGCSIIRSPIIEPVVMEGAEADAVLAYAQVPAENLLEGLLAADYNQFSRDFSDEMKQGMNEQAFNDLLASFDSKIGNYQTSGLVTVLKEEKYSTLIYRLTYEKDEVAMRVVFDLAEPHKISGLWFDSPELRKN